MVMVMVVGVRMAVVVRVAMVVGVVLLLVASVGFLD